MSVFTRMDIWEYNVDEQESKQHCTFENKLKFYCFSSILEHIFFIRLEKSKLQYIKNGQYRDTGNIGHKTENEEKQNTTQKTKKMSDMDSIKNGV